MIRAIDTIVNNDWGFTMIDLKQDLHKPYGKCLPFTHKESEEMSAALGKIYQIVHCIDCEACSPKV